MTGTTTAPESRKMAEPRTTAASLLWRWAGIIGLTLAMAFLLGVGVGFVKGYSDHGGGLGIKAVAILAALLLALTGCAWLLQRLIRSARPEEPLTRKERLNRNILIAAGLLGGVIGMVLALTGTNGAPAFADVFSDGPLPAGLAIALVVTIGVLVPAISLYWHRHAVDEQESAAYKNGALIALYVYMIGAPVWWFAWRGGFAPEPHGVIIYVATVSVLGIIWIWKKYG